MSTPPGPVPPDGTPPGNGHVPDAAADDRTTVEAEAGPVETGTEAGSERIGEPLRGEDGGGEDDESGPDPLRFNRWMRSSASGGILTGIALGLQHALEERREQPAFVMEAPGEPEDPDAPISLHFDPDDPTKTIAVIRSTSDDARRDGSSPPSGGV